MGPPTYAKGNSSSASSIVQLDTDVFNGWSKEDVLVAAPRRVVGVSVLMDHCDYVERLWLCHQAQPPDINVFNACPKKTIPSQWTDKVERRDGLQSQYAHTSSN